jgi:putative membrane protein
MKQLLLAERACLIGHLVSMAFGLAGLLLVMPHPEFLSYLPAGQTMFRWSMAGGGVVYILLGAIAVAIHAYRTLGLRNWLTFMIPAIVLSLGSELSGTGTGFPFGDYSYLSGLGYKVAGLVPFTIPLSWFYLGLSSYLLARAGLDSMDRLKTVDSLRPMAWWRQIAAVVVGAVLLTSWDFVLDPAMSQTAMPFWYWHEPGAFFGMPYQNFAGWMATGMLFMAVATVIWFRQPIRLTVEQLNLPFVVYIGNFTFATVMSLAAGFWQPVLLGILLGLGPAALCWNRAKQAEESHLAIATDARLGMSDVSTEPVGVPTK